MTKKEIYTAALVNCVYGEGEKCKVCPYDGCRNCISKLMWDIRYKEIEPEDFIAAGLIKKGYVSKSNKNKPYYYEDVAIEPSEKNNIEVVWFKNGYYAEDENIKSFHFLKDVDDKILCASANFEKIQWYFDHIDMKKNNAEYEVIDAYGQVLFTSTDYDGVYKYYHNLYLDAITKD